MKIVPVILLIFLLSPALTGCGDRPEPVEIRLVLAQQEQLLGAGALLYAPDEYRVYREELDKAAARLDRERERFVWVRDYRPVAVDYGSLLVRGRDLAVQVRLARERERAGLDARLEKLAVRLTLLRDLSKVLKDRRLALPGLVKVELGLAEARRLAAADRTRNALAKLAGLEEQLAAAIGDVKPLLARYGDRDEIQLWRRQLADAIGESRRTGGQLLVVSKAERQLIWYRRGLAQRTYDAGLGFRFLSVKEYGGDLATPEGFYRVTRKLPDSKYFRALLIDYPNLRDRQRYEAGRRKASIPAGKAIGGSIEIHGGGREAMTEGCIALDDQDMAEIYGQIQLDTPVLIIGTSDYDNIMAAALRRLR